MSHIIDRGIINLMEALSSHKKNFQTKNEIPVRKISLLQVWPKDFMRGAVNISPSNVQVSYS